MPQSKEVHRDYMKRRREGSQEGSQDTGFTGQGSQVTLWPPSRFISPEEDMKMQERVIEAMQLMTGSRLGAFRMLSNVFTPNKVRDGL